MIHEAQLDDLTPSQLRELTERLLNEVRHKQATIDKLTHENAVLKRMKFAASSEVIPRRSAQPLVDALKAEMLSHRVLHADETPVAMLDPGAGETHRAYLWSYCTGQFEDRRIVVYDFAESRAGKHAMEFLGDWARCAGLR